MCAFSLVYMHFFLFYGGGFFFLFFFYVAFVLEEVKADVRVRELSYSPVRTTNVLHSCLFVFFATDLEVFLFV